MKALLLAAGKGTRISRYLNGRPKCTVDIGNGVMLINYTIDLLRKKGIDEIAVVTGYQHKVIEEILENSGVKLYYSPFFDVTNSIVSAWFAKDFLDDDMIIMNADVFCEEKIYDEILKLNSNPLMIYDSSRIKEADYKFYCPDNKILKYGKDLSEKETTGEYVGIAKLKRDFMPIFKERLNDMVCNQEHGVWWENVLYSMSDAMDIYAHDVSSMFWAEVDYIEDYERIRTYVKNGNVR